MSTIKKAGKKGFYVSYRSFFGVIVVFILVLLFVVSIVQNAGNITLRFLFFDYSVPAIAVISGSMILGFIGGIFFARKLSSKKKAEN
jgi:uncharacterized integral membrane protein